ncbi:DNA polymerase III subunit beta [Helicobacter trogontum]|uniref:Beta sliding clamp n=1 Tax=Helicobacter trogontum TaxID=50960 RepID=A0A4U8TFS6_9HELI|nr:DNA polymerase III subunit beta [Helicobacter trogontum]MCI5785947.1 DNA polymerase III subunit beta [Helicobacter trogontum]MDY5185302.1 DNA polymerase III subunit beta [Helicobacter trogontum]TLD98956.1 DNA polymerase III subunit beta [Helicobacter trogontum]
MNIISIDKSKLDQAITNMQSAINKKNAIDITANISLETTDNKLILKATDHEIYIRTTLKTNSIQGEIKCAVNGEAIGNFIKGLNDTEVIIEQDNENLYIKQNKASVFKIPIFEINDFPFSQDYKNEQQDFQAVDINNNFLLQSLKKIMHCCNDKESFNIAMQGILFEIKDNQINIAATDSKRLGYIQKQTECNKDFISIIPKKTLQEILKLFSTDCELYVKPMQDSNKIETICFVNEDVEFYAKLINANFPDFKSIISNKPQTPAIQISKEKILKTLNQMNAICQRVKVTFETNKIIFETLEGMNGASASVTINDIENHKTETITIGLVNRHLLECISNIKQEEFELIIDDPYKPIFIITKDFEEVIMPQIL